MAFTPSTEHKHSRSDVFVCDPRDIVIDWTKNLARGGQEPPVDDSLKQLAMSIRPKNQGGSGQLQPIVVRPMADRRLELIMGFRRMRAALWLVESGECPDFQIQCSIRRLTDSEAAISNLIENIDREDPRPIQIAHAVRSLHEDYGIPLDEVAKRLNRSENWITKILDLTLLPEKIQESVTNGKTTVTAALELARVPLPGQMTMFEGLDDSKKITAAAVKEAKRKWTEAVGEGYPAPRRGIKQLKSFLAEVSAEGENAKSRKLGIALEQYMAGKLSDTQMIDTWRRLLS